MQSRWVSTDQNEKTPSPPTGEGERPTNLPSRTTPSDPIVVPIESVAAKIFIFLLTVAALFFVARNAVREFAADRLAQNPTIENLRKAIRLTPANAELHYVLGHQLEATLEESDLRAALAEYEQAVRLNPHNGFYWLRLAQAYESPGRIDDARRAVEQAVQVDPNQPLVAWQVGNFFFRDGRVEEALRQFRVVLMGIAFSPFGEDPNLEQAVFDLAWRGTENNRLILDLLLPADSRIHLDYLHFLLAKGKLDESLQAWERLVRERLSFRPNAVFPLIDALIAARRVDEARATWKQLVSLQQLLDMRSENTNLIVNGGFEGDILNGGFDWRFTPVEHVALQFDTVSFRGGTRSVTITFDGKENVAYGHFWQLVPVQPNTWYRFRGWMKSERITTDTGPHFELADFFAPMQPLAAGEAMLGSNNWHETNLRFRTGPETKLVRIAVVRAPSRKFDNKIQGQIWIDDLSLQSIRAEDQVGLETTSAGGVLSR